MSRITKYWHILCLVFTILFIVFTGGCAEEESVTDKSAIEVTGQTDDNVSDQFEGEEFSKVKPPSEKDYIDPSHYPEIYAIALQYISDMDNDVVLAQMKDTDSWNTLIQYVYQIEHEDEPVMHAWGLPDCGYLYGTYTFSAWANYPADGRMRYLWSPNCTIVDTFRHCGPDRDNLVSFWMGPDWNGASWVYRISAIRASVNIFLLAKQAEGYYRPGIRGNFRVHLSAAYGNAYVCLPSSLDASSLRFGWR